jgi:hypothetical protein
MPHARTVYQQFYGCQKELTHPKEGVVVVRPVNPTPAYYTTNNKLSLFPGCMHGNKMRAIFNIPATKNLLEQNCSLAGAAQPQAPQRYAAGNCCASHLKGLLFSSVLLHT